MRRWRGREKRIHGYDLRGGSDDERSLGDAVNLVSADALKRTSLFVDRFIASRDGISILIYHQVGADHRGSVNIDTTEFERQMEMIAASGRAITLDRAVERLATGDSSPGVVVTFDDGTADYTDIAVPIMVRHGIPSLLYAETDPISTGKPNAAGHQPTSWAALRDAASTGLVEIGSHTHSHRLLHNVDEKTAIDELDRSIAVISEQISRPPLHFAYPKAVRGNTVAERAVRERFRSAVLGHGGANKPGRDLHRLARNPIQRHDSPEMVSAKIDGGMKLEGAIRSALGRWRYRNHLH